MLSWKLWRALNNPPRHHPLFQYVLSKAKREEPKVTSIFFMWAFMCSTITFFWTIVLDWVPYLVLAVLILFNTIYSVRWVLRISATIAREKEHRRYDLLASLPSGLLGISWAISTGCVHRRSSFRWMPYLMLLGVVCVCFMLSLFVAIAAFVIETNSMHGKEVIADIMLMELGIIGFALMVIFYFDHIYSTLTAILIGQIISVDLIDATEARIRAFLAFLSLQFLLYITTYTVMILILPKITQFFGFDGIWNYVSLGLIGIVFFLILREILVKLLWYTLHHIVLADEKEIALVLEPSYLLDKILNDGELRAPPSFDGIG